MLNNLVSYRQLEKSLPTPSLGLWFNGFTKIGSTGVMEVGKHIDFHFTNESGLDYSTRISCTNSTDNYNLINLPTSHGTLALVSDIETAIGDINTILDSING